MRKNDYILILLFLFSITLYATPYPKDSTKTTTKTVVTDISNLNQTIQNFKKNNGSPIVNTNTQFRSFPELATYTTNSTAGPIDDLVEFTKEYLKTALKTNNKTDSIFNAAEELFAEIEEHGKFINLMAGNELVELPVGIQKRLGGGKDEAGNPTANDQHTTITIGIIKAKLFPEYSELDLFAKLEIGELNTVLFFGASGVKLSHTGGMYGEARLNLLKDVPVGLGGGQWLLTFKGDLDKATGNADEQTYITIDCEGNVKEVAIAADVRIAKTVAVPIKEDGSYKYPNDLEPRSGKSPVNNDSYVGAIFRVELASISDLVVELNLPRFELKKLPNWGFQMKNVVLDVSDTRNAKTKIDFPKVYTQQQLLVPGNEELWRGFYSEHISIILPPEFRVKDSEDRITIGAKNLIIDNFGVSGNFYATDVMHLNEGNANKWQFSVDELEVDLQVNQFVKAKFNGEIVLPVTTLKDKKEKDSIIKHGALKYKGLITADRLYTVNVNVTEDVDFDIFKSKAKLFRDSYIKLEVKDNKFQPEANLTGLMSFNNSQEAALDSLNTKDVKSAGSIEELNFEGLSFQNFKIQTAKRPYLEIGYMGYKDSITMPKIYGFEMGFYDIKVKSDTADDSAELGFNGYINLDESGIHGDVRIRVIGELVDGDYLKWKYKKVELDSISVDVKRKSFEFHGKLHFFREHEMYGKGLAGKLDLYMESIGLRIGAKGIFGNVDDYRYWYVDAYGQPTSSKNKNFTIYDIGGGVYHHMRKAGVDERAGTMSGIYYAPDKTVLLGFKALAAFEVKKSATFTGLVALEMSFNTKEEGSGVRRIGFYGAAALMTGKSSGGSGPKAQPFGDVKGMQEKVASKEESLSNFHELSIDKEGIKYFATEVFPDLLTGKELFAAQVGIDFDYKNQTYFAMLDVFLNAGAIKGEGEKNRLGYLEFYNSPKDWYMYIGEPEKRIGVKDIPIGPYMAAINLYYMSGTILPDPAKPDQIVLNILDLSEDELAFGRNFSDELAVGNGYAFGATFRLGMGFDWGIVYASIQAGVGFDLMMRNFGDAHCRGSEEVVGMDGWYATGQLYAYLVGEIGVRINLFGIKKDIPILEAGLATLAQAQLPNPWYMVGYSGIKVRVLGMVTVKARLKIVIGEECELMGKTGLQNVTIISDITPSDKATEVDVFNAVQVAFNAPIDDEVIVEEDSGRKTYRVSLNEFNVSENGATIQGEMKWNGQKDLLTFESTDVLPPQKEITAIVKVSFEEKVNGSWKPVTDNDGNINYEEKTVTFTTGDAPQKIPLKNIVYMYPVKDQQFFFPKESNVGYIQLQKGQDYLFGISGFKDEMFYIDENGASENVTFSYDNVENKLNFGIPKLKNQVTYTYKLITSANQSGQQGTTAQGVVQIADSISMTQNVIAGQASTDALFVRLSFEFNTSRHNTFKAKMNSLKIENQYTLIDGKSSVGAMGIGLREYESFGINDVKGTNFTNYKPLLRLEGIPTDKYYTERIYPLIYKNYPLDGNITVNRDETILGLPPQKSLFLSNSYNYYVSAEPNHNYLKQAFPFRWHLARAYDEDFEHLRYTIVNRYLNGETVNQSIYDKFGYIINGVFPYINKEVYKVKIEYVLPNQNSGNSAIIDYKNNF
ncbi:hypothetical protein FF125_20325 [Aureibaculum algae]|uniref:Uncharacterized protein n=1 Tax=Aureibaculum algae TaxID=2584122 RepID=A0A5B7U138_9FLAO|nr:Ig-like domain-containing protein [Aureibaculum algae]QCX40672.1 hypothetical protein FF125_20325 [Aureibaculum algae]